MDSDLPADPFLQSLPHTQGLPPAVVDLHSRPGRFSGRCSIVRGTGALTALALRIGRFPPTADDVPVTLTTQHESCQWTWYRDFGGHKTVSNLYFDTTRGQVRENIGGLSLWMRPKGSEGKLLLDIATIKLLGCPCPRLMLPRSNSVEWQDDQGRFCFDISAWMPGVGPLIRYRGWLTRDHGIRQTT